MPRLMVRALVVPQEGPPSVEQLRSDPGTFEQRIGRQARQVQVAPGAGIAVYAAAEATGEPVNDTAVAVLAQYGARTSQLSGTVIVVGSAGKDGWETDAPEWVEKYRLT